MLATGRYAQWRSRFLRYIDTRPNDDALRKCILEGPYTPTTIVVPAVPQTDDSSAVLEHITVETPINMSPENKAHYELEKEAIHLILTGIGDEIYSTVDACKIAHEMWEAIERLQQGESPNIQDVKTNLFWSLVNSPLTMEKEWNLITPEWSRFVTIVKQQHKLDEVSYHKLFDILKQYQKEVNELHAERIARNANPLALVATAQSYQDPYYQTPKPHKPYTPTSKASIPTRSHATTRHKGKEIAKPITPPSENKNLDTTLRYKNDNQSGQFRSQRMVNVAGARENVQYNDVYNVFANVNQHCEQSESTSNTCLVEKDDSAVTPDSPDMCEHDIQTDQNAKDEHDALANLIVNLKLNVDENKKIQNQLKKANTSLAHELEQCKYILYRNK
nr:hypothetical protein [Tanacetum cinerariifolium]